MACAMSVPHPIDHHHLQQQQSDVQPRYFARPYRQLDKASSLPENAHPSTPLQQLSNAQSSNLPFTARHHPNSSFSANSLSISHGSVTDASLTPRANTEAEDIDTKELSGISGIADLRQLYHVSGVYNAPPNSALNFHGPIVLQYGGAYNSLSMNRQTHLSHMPPRGASATLPQRFCCPNCSKSFARDDLLRRHLAREARAAAQPAIDRRKSCHECARSKARCDLDLPSCGRCKSREKICVYRARTENPNVQKGVQNSFDSRGDTSQQWSGIPPAHEDSSQHWNGGVNVGKEERKSSDAYESDDSHNWKSSFQSYQNDRSALISSNSTSAASCSNQRRVSQGPYEAVCPPDCHAGGQANSPAKMANEVGPQPSAAFISSYAGADRKGSMGPSLSNDGTLVLQKEVKDGEIAPSSRKNSSAEPMGGASSMRAQQVTRTQFREAGKRSGSSGWDPSSGRLQQNCQMSSGQHPQPPSLLTGAAKTVRPQEARRGELGSARPLFSAQIDLSYCLECLEERTSPSPPYHMGSTLSALVPGRGNTLLQVMGSRSGTTAKALRSALATHPPLPQMALGLGMDTARSDGRTSSDSMMDMEQQGTMDNKCSIGGRNPITSEDDHESGERAQVAASQWWAQSAIPAQSDAHIQEVARVCAGHFTIYPALMLLPESASPLPPLFHRPWLTHARLTMPSSLARTRILLASYHVKLPSSENMVWEMIISEVRHLVAQFDQHVGANDMEVFSSTAALWFLIILLLISSDPSGGTSIPNTLVDSSLIGLSRYSRLLCQRLQCREESRTVQSASRPSFLEWGFEESMKRTLFASYSLLVLQRFRETSTEIQEQLAGAELVLDVPLPASAIEFDADNELEWQACQNVQITDSPSSGSSRSISLRDLLDARKEGNGMSESKRKITSYFNRHDNFTNVCLSVAFALDRSLSWT